MKTIIETVHERGEDVRSIVLENLCQGRKFSILSAYRSDRGIKSNYIKHEELRHELQTLSGGLTEIEIGYKFMYQGTEELYEEKYFFVPRLTFYSLITLGKKYGQDIVIFNDFDGFNLVKTNTGNVLKAFGLNVERPKFTREDIPYVFKQFFNERMGTDVNPEIVFYGGISV